MQKQIMIILCIILICTFTLFALEIEKHTEYGYDRDANKTSHHFFREKIDYVLGYHHLYITFLRARNSNNNAATYCLFLNDEPFIILLGHYQVQIGTGLALANRNSFATNAFLDYTSQNNKKKFPFIPSTNGNPLYSFRGAALSFRMLNNTHYLLLLHTFYSHSYSYIEDEDSDSMQTDYTLAGIEREYQAKQRSTTPLSLMTAGTLISIQMLPYVLFQFYTFKIWNHTITGEKVAWKVRENLYAEKIYEYGYYTAYKDHYLHLFYEHAFSIIALQGITGKTHLRDHAFQTGFKFSHPYINLACTHSYCHRNYYAPFSNPAGGTTPATRLLSTCTVKPSSYLHFSTHILFEKKFVTRLNDQEAPYTKSQQFEITTKPFSSTSFLYRYTVICSSQDTITRTRQHRANARVYFSRKNYIAASYQQQSTTCNDSSSLYSVTQSSTVYTYHTIYTGYAYASISGQTRVYSSLGTQPGTSLQGSFLKTSTSVFSIKYRYKKGWITLFSRLQLHCKACNWTFFSYDLALHIRL